MANQIRALAGVLPSGEEAREQVGAGLEQMMEEEPFWPIADRPANPALASFCGFDDERDDALVEEVDFYFDDEAL